MAGRAPALSIILAAGKGTRMQSATMHKVCFPIDGRPAIHRALETYNACGIRHHVVVVGALAGQVVETVGREFRNVTFVYQAEQSGTADAAGLAAARIADLGVDEDLLLAAGDRLIEASVLEEMFHTFYSDRCDLVILATPRAAGSGQGRIVESPQGELLAVVEAADVRQRRVYRDIRARAEAGEALAPARLEQLMREGFAGRGDVPDAKLAKAFGAVWQAAAVEHRAVDSDALLSLIPGSATEFAFPSAGGRVVLTPDEVDAMPYGNTSVYLATAGALNHALGLLDRNNAQQEKYLSDIVAMLAGGGVDGTDFRVRAFKVDRAEDVMGYNDPAELLQVEAHIQSRDEAGARVGPDISARYRPVREWQEDFAAIARDASGASALREALVACYGTDADVLAERTTAYRAALDYAAEVFGAEQPALIVRSPGRVNVMGRHVDHQGGNCNLMTIGYETIMVVHAREDDRVRLHNLDRERFGEREFSIGELVADLPWDDWLSLVNSEKVSNMARTYGGDWSQYITAAVLRLQKKFLGRKLRGMDVVVSGNVPMAAGLSSSSSLVVGAAEATIAVNRLDTFPSQLVDLCGEGEWFVGTRGGSADHAAVKMGREGKVIKVTFFDFAVQEVVPFPQDYVMAVCDSGISAKKTANAKDQFNHRVACYRLGFHLVRKFFPQYAPLLHHLRDVNVRTLGIPLSWIYRILLHLPEQTTRDELRAALPGEDLDTLFSTHEPPPDGLYPIRGAVLFGLAECERSRLYADYLKRGDIEEIGRLMNVSHDGDRVAVSDGSGQRPFLAPTTNAHLLNLMEDLESGDPERVVRAQLQWQPGSYHCSLPEIDAMVDIALRTDGVVGAQLAGAGLGGCMMVLTRRDAIGSLIDALAERYYGPAGIPPAVLVCRPIAGAGVLMGG